MLRGKLTIKPLQRLHVDYIEYILIAAASEEGATMFSTSAILSKKTLARDYLASKCLLSEFEPYRYAISFSNDEIETYSGTNININILLRVRIKLDEKAINTKDTTYIGHLKEGTKFPSHGVLFHDLPLKFVLKEYDYQLINTTDILKSRIRERAWFNILLLVFPMLMVVLYIEETGLIYLISGIMGLTGLFYFLKYSIANELTLQYEQLDPKVFLLKLHSDNWQYIRRMSVKHEVREEMKNNEKFINNKKTVCLHRSKNHTINNPSKTIAIEHKFPKDIVGTTSVLNNRIYWVIVVTVQTIWRFTLRYEKEFIVKKKKKIGY